jgi:predicted DNA-binding transcriptional regulator AlpA
MEKITIYQLDLDELSNAVAKKVLERINQSIFHSQEEEKYLSRKEVASLCNVKSLSTLWSWNKKGLLVPKSKAGRKPLYRKSDVIQFLNNKKGGSDE